MLRCDETLTDERSFDGLILGLHLRVTNVLKTPYLYLANVARAEVSDYFLFNPQQRYLPALARQMTERMIKQIDTHPLFDGWKTGCIFAAKVVCRLLCGSQNPYHKSIKTLRDASVQVQDMLDVATRFVSGLRTCTSLVMCCRLDSENFDASDTCPAFYGHSFVILVGRNTFQVYSAFAQKYSLKQWLGMANEPMEFPVRWGRPRPLAELENFCARLQRIPHARTWSEELNRDFLHLFGVDNSHMLNTRVSPLFGFSICGTT